MIEKQKSTPAVFLHKANPNLAASPAAENSARAFERRTGKKAGNAESKIGALVMRLESISERPRAKDRLANRFAETLLVDEEDIPDTYWTQQEQLQRDNGHGHTLSEHDKDNLVEQLRDAQRTSIDSWTSYLGSRESSYPSWFKLYSFDGMTKMGIFDKKEGKFKKRSKGTVAPYPQLNPAALAKTYDFVSKTKIEGAETEDDQPQSNNFNVIYSHFLIDTSAMIATPERAEDVSGEWRHYTDVNELSAAAQGTPWCIAGEKMANHYLTQPDAGFYLFHLQDEETGRISPTAAASIRMEDGRVSEISGLAGGSNQYLEDALVPTVMEKVRILPGGEDYIEAFEDKQKLIEMDRKFQKQPRVPFTVEELEFLYEVHKKIKQLDTYNMDPRLEEFRQEKVTHKLQFVEKYGESGARIIMMQPHEVEKELTELLKSDSEHINLIVSKLDPSVLSENFHGLLAAGANPNVLTMAMRPFHVDRRFHELLQAGADRDILFSQISNSGVSKHLDDLLEIQVDPNKIAARMPWFFQHPKNGLLKKLLDAGADPSNLASTMSDDNVAINLEILLQAGFRTDPYVLASKIKDFSAQVGSISGLVMAGADPDKLVADVKDVHILEKFGDRYIAAGANPSVVQSRIDELSHPQAA